MTRPRLLDEFTLRCVRIFPGVNSRAELVTLARGLYPKRRRWLGDNHLDIILMIFHTFYFKDKPVNAKFTAKSDLLHGKIVNLQCTSDADPKARFSIFGGGIIPVGDSTTGIVTIRVDLAKDGRIVKCTPSNRLGHGPTADLLLDVKGKYYTVNSACKIHDYRTPSSS